MVFSSPVFLFLFLPLSLAAYFLAPRALRNAALLAASLLFYAWGEKGYVLLMLASIAANYLLGLWVGAWRDRPAGRLLLALAVLANVALLVSFKYANFLADNLNLLLVGADMPPVHLRPVHLPVGISFFTFEAIAYLVDIRRGVTPAQRGPVKFGLFMTLFPHLVAGPVVRYRDIAAALDRGAVDLAQFASGVRRFVVGLAKKVLLANTLARTADLVFAQSPEYLDPSAAWLGVLCYTLQIYFDFSGYSDMAIGLGRLFGFELAENFRHPYAATSVTDFWRRWHVSLSSWFRDYVYVPLGGGRRGAIRTALNLFAVFTLCGLWHGASWTFLAWGLYHGLFLTLERIRLLPSATGAGGRGGNQLLAPLRTAYTLAVVMIGWVLFRCESPTHAGDMLAAMAGSHRRGHGWADYWNAELAIALGVGLLAALPTWPLIVTTFARSGATRASEWLASLALIVLLAACAVALTAGTFNPFIYFRF